MTATAAAIKRLDDLFENIRLQEERKTSTNKKRSKEERVHFSPVVISKDCDIHGRKSSSLAIGNNRRSTTAMGPRRESMPAGLNSVCHAKPLLAASLSRETLVHPAAFSSTLRKNAMTASVGSLKRNSRDSPASSAFAASRKNLSSSLSASAVHLNGAVTANRKQQPPTKNGFMARRDYVNNSLVTSKRDGKTISSDSLDSFKKNSWDFNNRRNSSSGSSAGIEDPIWEEDAKSCRQDGDGQSNGSVSEGSRLKFLPVTTLEDVQAVRCAEFHPRGSVYAVGSNSRTLRICEYPHISDLTEDHIPHQPTVLFKRTRHHKGSIYCMSWTPDGDLLATGSNDKTVKLMRFNIDTANLEGQEIELVMHDGTVRDVCFIEDTSNKSSLLISGGAGDCKIYVTDCATGQPYQSLSGHSGAILSLYNWGGAVFASGSQDRTVRFWDLRARGSTNIVTPVTSPANRQGAPVSAVCVDPSGRLLVSGHEDSACVLYDIRGSRTLQSFRPHTANVRSIRFSPSAYYLLTAGYDNKLVLTNLQGDLTASLPSVVVAQHQDKVISGRWHPAEFSFLSSSADKTATLWALPPI